MWNYGMRYYILVKRMVKAVMTTKDQHDEEDNSALQDYEVM